MPISNIAPPARYDSPWKAVLTHAFKDFMAFYFSDLCLQIDWAKKPQFREKELAGISFGGKPDGLVADKLVEVWLQHQHDQHDQHMKRVLIHIEIQAQRDGTLARRVLDYNYRIFNEYEQPVASLVLLADENPKWRPSSFNSRVLGTVTDFSFRTAKLLDYTSRTEELLESDNPFAWITMVHLRTQNARHDADQLYAAKWQLTRLLYQHGWCKRRIIVLFLFIEWMMVLPEDHQERYWQAVLKLEKERNMEWISPMQQSFINQGRKEEALTIVERQLTRRFGPLPKTVRKKIEKASLEQLEAWSDVLPDAQSLKQVFG